MNDTKLKKEQYVYIMSNACYDADVVKIGWTSKHPFHRASQLNTGAPTPFIVDSVIITTKGPKLEKQIHNHLKQVNIQNNFQSLLKHLFSIFLDDLVLTQYDLM